MHFGIVLLMAPNYWIHSWCVGVLLTDWAWLQQAWEARSLPGRSRARVEPAPAGPRRSHAGALAATLIVAAVVPPVAQIEWFPVTHIPMYSSYVTADVIGGVPIEDFGDETRVRALARGCAGSRAVGYPRRCPWRTPRALIDRVTLELSGAGRTPQLFAGSLGFLRYPVIERLAATSEEESEATAELVDRVRALLLAEGAGPLSGYGRFRLEYRLTEGAVMLAEGPLEDAR